MKIICPRCKQVVPAEQINMSTDLALCPACNEGFRVSESLAAETITPDVLQNPPSGTWFRQELDETVVGASTRHPMAFFLVPFMCAWSGLSLGLLYGSQIVSGEFNLFLSLFGIPFLLGTLVLGTFVLKAVFGKVEVRIGRGGSSVFVGVGSLGWTRRFDWAEMHTVREESMWMNAPGQFYGVIVLEGKTRLRFGTGLRDNRRLFILNVLRHLKAQAA